MLRWIALGCCLLLAAPQDPADKVRAMIEKLESEQIGERDRAEVDLGLLGRKILPQLERAAAASRGETKERLVRVIGRLTAFGSLPYVTLKVKDKPVREILAECERQSGIPIRCPAVPESMLASLDACRIPVWKALDDVCRSRGDLMCRYDDWGVEVRPGRSRSHPSVDQDGLRFFIESITWERDTIPYNGAAFKIRSAVLAPPGARLLWMHVDMEELREPKGPNLAEIPERSFVPSGGAWGPDSRRITFADTFRAYGLPTPEASKLERCSGKVVLLFAAGERVLARVPDPLSAPSKPAPEGLPALGVDRWKFRAGYLSLGLTAGYDAESVKGLSWGLAPLILARLKDGGWRSPYSLHFFHPGPEACRRGPLSSVFFEMEAGTEIASLDLVVPDPILKVEIPFDFRDIPLR